MSQYECEYYCESQYVSQCVGVHGIVSVSHCESEKCQCPCQYEYGRMPVSISATVNVIFSVMKLQFWWFPENLL